MSSWPSAADREAYLTLFQLPSGTDGAHDELRNRARVKMTGL